MKSILHRLGYDIAKYTPANVPRLRRMALLQRMDVTVVLDVGANVGQFGSEIREDGYTGRIVSFEPLHPAFAVLTERADESWECLPFALGAEDGEAVLHVSADTWSSSLRRVHSRLVAAAPTAATASEAMVAVRRLDSLREEILRPDDRAFLKIDTQGYEREVLAGACQALRQVLALELELSLVRLYEGQQLLPSVLQTTEGLGFSLVNIANGFIDPVSGELLQVDALFARR